jgi:quinol monooxygenase YgiN
MAVKVLIERTVRQGYEPYVLDMLQTLRGEALRQKGYLYGETWRSLQDPQVIVVVSTWGTRAHWDIWSVTPFRQKMEERLGPMLAGEPRVQVFEEHIGP